MWNYSKYVVWNKSVEVGFEVLKSVLKLFKKKMTQFLQNVAFFEKSLMSRITYHLWYVRRLKTNVF